MHARAFVQDWAMLREFEPATISAIIIIATITTIIIIIDIIIIINTIVTTATTAITITITITIIQDWAREFEPAKTLNPKTLRSVFICLNRKRIQIERLKS